MRASTKREENEITELWKEHRRAQQQRRASRLPARQAEVLALTGKGFRVEQKTEHHFRVDAKLDLFPIHRRYHHIPTNTRGNYRQAVACAMKWLRERVHAS